MTQRNEGSEDKSQKDNGFAAMRYFGSRVL
jgi:hypothetical protein